MENQIVVSELGSEHFGIEIAKVESIIKMQAITRLSHVSSFVEGVMNLRGKVLPVIDQMEPAASHANSMAVVRRVCRACFNSAEGSSVVLGIARLSFL